MPYAERAFSSSQALTRAQQRTVKAVLIGFAYVAGLVLIAMAQITLDSMAADVDPDQTAIDTRAD